MWIFRTFCKYVFFAVTLLFSSAKCSGSVDEFELKIGLDKINFLIEEIFTRWDIQEYPLFLRSSTTTEIGWDIFKNKFKAKLHTREDFVLTFMGSSVTAGHSHTDDQRCNESFPYITGRLLTHIFSTLGIKLVVRNSGVGNQVCIPYDICVEAFAGLDSDMIVWENTYNRFPKHVGQRPYFERFIRQALSTHSRPILVFTTSRTPNWETSSCPNGTIAEPLTSLTAEEELVLSYVDRNPKLIFSNLNIEFDRIGVCFPAIKELFDYYDQYAGIQLFRTDFNADYMCHGPYIADWTPPFIYDDSKPWLAKELVTDKVPHPLKMGHQLRSDHLCLQWLLMMRESINDLLIGNVTEEESNVKTFSESNVPILYQSYYQDGQTCYTTTTPLVNKSYDLRNLVISDVSTEEINVVRPFELELWETFVLSYNITEVMSKRQCLDSKVVYWADSSDQRISFKVHAKQEGHIHICSTKINDYHSLDDLTIIYLTENVESYSAFFFDKSQAKQPPFIYYGDRFHCVHPHCVRTFETVQPGQHILTLASNGLGKAQISALIIP